jgi:outer membrane receptor protein involved in Fe transport
MKSLGLLAASLLLPAAAEAAVYSFNLGPPGTSQNSAGYTIRIAGGGTFDTSLGTVLGNGAYSISDPAGKVIERGTWAADSFGSFDPQGGINNGVQGGELHISITLYPNGGAPKPNMPMTVICPFENDEGGFNEENDAVLVGDFAQRIGGITVFHLIAP